MKPETLNEYLQQPEALRNADVAELRELAKQFPYFTSVYYFILKNNKLNSNSLTAEEIAMTSFRAPDRARLKEYLYAENKNAPQETEAIPAISMNERDSLYEILTESEAEVSPQLAEES